jgi:hypothetical protein
MLVRCLYASRPSPSLDPAALDRILQQSRRNNPARGVTGLLCVAGNLFLQVLEGGRDDVCETFNAIVRDDRHRNVRILSFEEIQERKFGGWTMGHVNIAKVNPALLLKYASKPVLNPFSCSGRASLSLLDELSATASVLGRAG